MSSPSLRSRRSARAVIATGHASDQRSLESLALGVGAVAFVVTALLAVPVFRLQAAPISGPGSIGGFAAVAAGVVAVLAFIAGRYVVRSVVNPGRLTVFHVLDVAALAFAHGIIAVLTWTLLANILERGFTDAEVFAVPVLILGGAVASVTAYVVFYSATHIDLALLALVLAVFLVEGVIASTLTASDPYWWKENLSALGMTDDVSAMTFNLTLVVAGFLVTTLARSATSGIPTTHPRGAAHVRSSLVVVGLFLACVGVFHVDDFFVVHTAVASGMVVAFGVLVVRLPIWIPGMPRAFVLLGWLFTGVIVVLAVFFAIGYYTLTAVELVAGILVFTWIILFIRNAAALQADQFSAAGSPGPARRA